MNKHLARLIQLFLLTAVATSLQATPALPNQQAECVGYYQLSLPGNIEYPVLSLQDFTHDDLDGPKRYSDGVRTNFARPPVVVSEPVSSKEFDSLRESQLRGIQNERKRFLDSAEKRSIPILREDDLRKAAALSEVPLEVPDAFAARSIYGTTGYFYRGGRIYPLHGTTINESIKRLRARSPFEIPSDPGICFPYGFLADNGKPQRHVQVTMRLADHPDVEIYFDVSRTEPPRSDEEKANKRTVEQEHVYFWEGGYASRHKKTWLKGLIAYRSVTLDGRKGVKTFGEIERKDGSIDYGYLAIVQGDPEVDDMPKITLFVVRTAAQSRGKTPVTEDELKDIAEAIAASVKRRR